MKQVVQPMYMASPKYVLRFMRMRSERLSN